MILISFLIASNINAMKAVKKVNVKNRAIAITFDDGPNQITLQILDILREEQVRVTFFLTGKKIIENINISKTVLNDGHEIGNHTMSHFKLTDIKNEETLRNEISDFQKLCKNQLKITPKVFRSPYFKYNRKVKNILKNESLILIDKSINSKDYKKWASPDTIYKKATSNIKPGDIIIMHDIKITLTAIHAIITELKKQNFTFLTVSELLQQ